MTVVVTVVIVVMTVMMIVVMSMRMIVGMIVIVTAVFRCLLGIAASANRAHQTTSSSLTRNSSPAVICS